MRTRFTTNPEYVTVMYVTDATFDNPHPNADHMTGLVFDPIARTVELDCPCDDDETTARVGDVIVRHDAGTGTYWDSIWSRASFENCFVLADAAKGER